MRAQDNTGGVARLIVVRLFLWLAPTFQWKHDACLDRNLIWSPEHNRIAGLMPVDTAEAQKARTR
jgi:hypothetical protein